MPVKRSGPNPSAIILPLTNFRRLPRLLNCSCTKHSTNGVVPHRLTITLLGSYGRDDVFGSDRIGKRRAFLLPVIQSLRDPKIGHALCWFVLELVLAPTRELAIQIELETRKLILRISATRHAGYGGAKARSTSCVSKITDIVVATPGNIDFVDRGFSLSGVKFLVLDEVTMLIWDSNLRFVGCGATRHDFTEADLHVFRTFPENQRLARDFMHNKNDYVWMRWVESVRP